MIVVIQPSMNLGGRFGDDHVARAAVADVRLVTDAVVRELDGGRAEKLGDERADRVADGSKLLGEVADGQSVDRVRLVHPWFVERFDRGHRRESRMTSTDPDEGGFRVASGHRVAVHDARSDAQTARRSTSR